MKHCETEGKGLERKDFEAGVQKLEVFKVRDKLEDDKEKQKVIVSKREQLAFEKALIEEAKAYTVEASKRLEQESGQRRTVRKSLAEIYTKMREQHASVVSAQFKLETYGMKEGSETHKKAYP